MVDLVNYVSQNINKIRWKPCESSLEKPNIFVTGTTDEKQNVLGLWDISHIETDSNVKDDLLAEHFEEKSPNLVSKFNVGGDVTELSFLKNEGIVAGTSSGSVSFLTFDRNFKLSEEFKWSNLYGSFGGCSGVDVHGGDIVTCGENGAIHVLHTGCMHPIHSIYKRDSCALNSVKWLTNNEVCVCNTIGQLHLHDLRSNGNDRIEMTSDDTSSLNSLARHPTQSHIVVAGGEDGCVTIFDVRKSVAAVAKLQIHQFDVAEVRFSQESPDLMYTCSGDQSVRKLDVSSNIRNSILANSNDLSAPPVQITEILSDCGSGINSIDISCSIVLCANESEAIYVKYDDF